MIDTERLRRMTPQHNGFREQLNEAADEIERLEVLVENQRNRIIGQRKVLNGTYLGGRLNKKLFHRKIVGALLSCIQSHGPITEKWTDSAWKRVWGAVKSTKEEIAEVERLRGQGQGASEALQELGDFIEAIDSDFPFDANVAKWTGKLTDILNVLRAHPDSSQEIKELAPGVPWVCMHCGQIGPLGGECPDSRHGSHEVSIRDFTPPDSSQGERTMEIFVCDDCGPGVNADEDGLCAGCSALTTTAKALVSILTLLPGEEK